MSKQLQLRGGTTAEHSTFTGADREVTVDTDKKTLVVHDGLTVGGNPIATKAEQDALNIKNGGGVPRNLNGDILYPLMFSRLAQTIDVTVTGVTAGEYADMVTFTYTPKNISSDIYISAAITKPDGYSDITELDINGTVTSGDQVVDANRYGELKDYVSNSDGSDLTITLKMRRISSSDGDVKLYEAHLDIVEKAL